MEADFCNNAAPSGPRRVLKAHRRGFQNQLFQTPLHSGGVSEWFSWLPLPELSRRKRRHYHIAAQYSLMDYNSFPFRKRPLE